MDKRTRTSTPRAAWLFLCMLPTVSASAVTLDVRDFGATPDDNSNDDLVSLQAAINAAAVGDTVYVPAGTYTVSNSLGARSGVRLIGAGSDATTIAYTGNSAHSILFTGSRTNVEISGFTLSGQSGGFATNGVRVQDSSNVNIHDIHVTSLAATGSLVPNGVLFLQNVTQSSVKNSKFTDIGVTSPWGSGIRMNGSSAFNTISNNTIDKTGRGGILIDDSTDNVIRSNVITGSGIQTAGLGIEAQFGADRNVIEDNTIDHWLSISESNFNAVRRNTISDTTGDVRGYGIELAGGSNNIFTDNNVGQGSKIGISISSAPAKDRILWSHNNVSGATTWGIQVQSETGGAATREYFYANTVTGTQYLTDPTEAFNGNIQQGHAVRFNGGASDIVFDSNVLSGNGGAGVQFQSGNSELAFVNNTITGNGSLGATRETVNQLDWTNNTMTGNGVRTLSPTADAAPIANGFVGNVAPTISIIAPITVHQGQPVTFGFTFADSGSVGNTYASNLWDFGDGVPVVDALNPTVTYANEGIYRVTLLAWDNTGRGAISEWTIAVMPEPASAGLFALAGWILSRRSIGTKRNNSVES